MDARPFYLACTTHLELSADNEEEGYTMAFVEFSEIRSVGSGPEGITLTLKGEERNVCWMPPDLLSAAEEGCTAEQAQRILRKWCKQIAADIHAGL